jgi:hypothetical protein
MHGELLALLAAGIQISNPVQLLEWRRLLAQNARLPYLWTKYSQF